MGNTIIFIIVALMGLLGSLFVSFLLYRDKAERALRGSEQKRAQGLRERDALATRVRCQRERLRILEKAEARRSAALEELVEAAWDVFEFTEAVPGVKKGFCSAFEAYTGKKVGLDEDEAVEENERQIKADA